MAAARANRGTDVKDLFRPSHSIKSPVKWVKARNLIREGGDRMGGKKRRQAARIRELSVEELREIATDRPDQMNELSASVELKQELHELIEGPADEAAEGDPWVVLWALERCTIGIMEILNPEEVNQAMRGFAQVLRDRPDAYPQNPAVVRPKFPPDAAADVRRRCARVLTDFIRDKLDLGYTKRGVFTAFANEFLSLYSWYAGCERVVKWCEHEADRKASSPPSRRRRRWRWMPSGAQAAHPPWSRTRATEPGSSGRSPTSSIGPEPTMTTSLARSAWCSP